MTACHQRNVFLAKDIKYGEEKKEKFISLIKNYSNSDVQGLKWLSERLDKKSPIKSTSLESLIVNYKGHNVFSIF